MENTLSADNISVYHTVLVAQQPLSVPGVYRVPEDLCSCDVQESCTYRLPLFENPTFPFPALKLAVCSHSEELFL